MMGWMDGWMDRWMNQLMLKRAVLRAGASDSIVLSSVGLADRFQKRFILFLNLVLYAL